MSNYMTIYPFEIKEDYSVFFTEDMHGFKMLTDPKSLDIIHFEKRCAEFLCKHLNSLAIEGLEVKIVGVPYRIRLIESHEKMNNVISIGQTGPDSHLSIPLYRKLKKIQLNNIMCCIVLKAAVFSEETDGDEIYISIVNRDSNCRIDYRKRDGELLCDEQYGHATFQDDDLELVYDKGLLVFKDEYGFELP